MSEVVLDASAVLAAVLQERGYEAVAALKTRALVSAVNYTEVRSRLIDLGLDRAAIDQVVGLVNMVVVDFDAGQAVMAAELRPATRKAGLSLGDRACLALAGSRNIVALTADRAWQTIDLPVEVQLVR